MYYILSQDFSIPSIKKVDYPNNILRISYFIGGKISDRLANLIIHIGNKKSLLQDSIVNFDKLLFFNKKLANLFTENSSDDFQLSPIDIVDQKGNKYESNHMLVTNLTLLDCIDKNNSEILYSPNNVILGINLLCLNEDALVGHDFFKIKDFPALTIVSDKLASILIKEKISGITFIQVDKFKI